MLKTTRADAEHTAGPREDRRLIQPLGFSWQTPEKKKWRSVPESDMTNQGAISLCLRVIPEEAAPAEQSESFSSYLPFLSLPFPICELRTI